VRSAHLTTTDSVKIEKLGKSEILHHFQ